MTNLNTLDRMLRVLLGFALLEMAFFWLFGGAQIGAYLVGAILLGTAAIRFCPLYRLLGVSTAGSDAKVAGMAMKTLVGVLLVASHCRVLSTKLDQPESPGLIRPAWSA